MSDWAPRPSEDWPHKGACAEYGRMLVEADAVIEQAIREAWAAGWDAAIAIMRAEGKP